MYVGASHEQNVYDEFCTNPFSNIYSVLQLNPDSNWPTNSSGLGENLNDTKRRCLDQGFSNYGSRPQMGRKM